VDVCGCPTIAVRCTARLCLGVGTIGGETELGWQVAAHPDKTGVFLLSDGLDAFIARAALIKMATVGFDVQHYPFHDDMTGTVLASLLVDAAARGVRVRLLVDDMGLSGRDHSIQLLDSQPNIDIRIFNPFTRSKTRIMQMLTRFGSVASGSPCLLDQINITVCSSSVSRSFGS